MVGGKRRWKWDFRVISSLLLCGAAQKQVTDDFLNPSQPFFPPNSTASGSTWLKRPPHTPSIVAHSEANPGLAPRFLPASSAFCDRWKMEENSWVGVTKGLHSTEGCPPAMSEQVESFCPMIKEAGIKPSHHMQLCWEGKWGRQGRFSYSWVPFLEESAGVLNNTLGL